MSPWVVLIIIILIILIVWWALLRNAKTYKADFPVHHEESHAEAGHGEQNFGQAAVSTAPEPASIPAEAVHPGMDQAEAAAVEAAAEVPPEGAVIQAAEPLPTEPAAIQPASQPQAPAVMQAPGGAVVFETKDGRPSNAPVGSTLEDPLHSSYAVPSETIFDKTSSEAGTGTESGAYSSADIVRDDFDPHSGEAGGRKSAVIQEGKADLAPPPPITEPVPGPATAFPSGPGPVKPDDLIIIEGIGPKINQLLLAAGITTFAQLAETSVERLRAILEPAGLRFIDPGSWPQQARLAAEGKMIELKAYQDRLRGGREV